MDEVRRGVQEHPPPTATRDRALLTHPAASMYNHLARVFEYVPATTSRSGSEHWSVQRTLYLLAESGGSAYMCVTERSYGIKLWTMIEYR